MAKKITKFDRAVIQTLTEEIKEAMLVIANKYGLVVPRGVGCSYSDASFSPKCEFAVPGDSNSNAVVTKQQIDDFIRYAELEGLGAHALNETLKLNGKVFTVVGYKRKARKNCILIADAKGKTFVTNGEALVRANPKLAVGAGAGTGKPKAKPSPEAAAAPKGKPAKFAVGTVTKARAAKLDFDYITWIASSNRYSTKNKKFAEAFSPNQGLSTGQLVLVYDEVDEAYSVAKVTKVSTDRGGDALVRVSNGNASWRVEHCAAL